MIVAFLSIQNKKYVYAYIKDIGTKLVRIDTEHLYEIRNKMGKEISRLNGIAYADYIENASIEENTSLEYAKREYMLHLNIGKGTEYNLAILEGKKDYLVIGVTTWWKSS